MRVLRFSNKPCFKKREKAVDSISTHFNWLQTDTLLDSVNHPKKTKINASEWAWRAIYPPKPIQGLLIEFSRDYKKCFQWSVFIIMNYFCITTPPSPPPWRTEHWQKQNFVKSPGQERRREESWVYAISLCSTECNMLKLLQINIFVERTKHLYSFG